LTGQSIQIQEEHDVDVERRDYLNLPAPKKDAARCQRRPHRSNHWPNLRWAVCVDFAVFVVDWFTGQPGIDPIPGVMRNFEVTASSRAYSQVKS